MNTISLICLLSQIIASGFALADSKKDDALFAALTAAFPSALSFPGHFTQEVSVLDLKCEQNGKSDRYVCRAIDPGSQEEVTAKTSESLVKALTISKSGNTTKIKRHAVEIFFSRITCTEHTQRARTGGQRQTVECRLEE